MSVENDSVNSYSVICQQLSKNQQLKLNIVAIR